MLHVHRFACRLVRVFALGRDAAAACIDPQNWINASTSGEHECSPPSVSPTSERFPMTGLFTRRTFGRIAGEQASAEYPCVAELSQRPASRRPNRRRTSWSAAALLAFVCAIILWSGTAGAGDMLADRHAVTGINCASCHGKTEPQATVESAVCATCHGAYAAIAVQTAKRDPNPHASHRGDLPCESCHHAHKPSVDFCMQCHDFGFKVP
jgi:hypothetical protein